MAIEFVTEERDNIIVDTDLRDGLRSGFLWDTSCQWGGVLRGLIWFGHEGDVFLEERLWRIVTCSD